MWQQRWWILIKQIQACSLHNVGSKDNTLFEINHSRMELWSGKTGSSQNKSPPCSMSLYYQDLLGGVSRSSHPQKEQMPYKVKWRTNPIPTLVLKETWYLTPPCLGVHSICPCAKIQMHKPQPTQEEMCLHWVSWWIQGVEVLWSDNEAYLHIRMHQVQWTRIHLQNTGCWHLQTQAKTIPRVSRHPGWK